MWVCVRVLLRDEDDIIRLVSSTFCLSRQERGEKKNKKKNNYS